MNILAAHDAEGNIYSILVSPPGAPPATVTTETGLMVTEVQAPPGLNLRNLSDPGGDARDVAELLQHLSDFQVEIKGKSKLVRKSAKSHK